MASSKTKVGVNMETNTVKENKSSAGSSAGETSPSPSPSPNVRIYCLDDLDTIATVGESITGYSSGKLYKFFQIGCHFFNTYTIQ